VREEMNTELYWKSVIQNSHFGDQAGDGKDNSEMDIAKDNIEIVVRKGSG
jgi:hypothetical protein